MKAYTEKIVNLDVLRNRIQQEINDRFKKEYKYGNYFLL